MSSKITENFSNLLVSCLKREGMENFLLSSIYNTNRVFLSKRYGIINRGDEENKGHPQIRIIFDSADIKNQKIILEQIEFMAITPEGSFLDVSAHSFEPGGINKKTFDSNVIVSVEEGLINHGVPLYLVLLTQPYQTVGFGQSIEREEPLRFPFCNSASELKCVRSNSPVEHIVGSNHFPIAKIKIINHRLELDKDYIPPCVNLSAHPMLMNVCLDIIDGLFSLLNTLDATFQRKKKDVNKELSYLTEILFFLYMKLIETTEFFNSEKDVLNPLEIINGVKVIALQLKRALLLNSGAYTFLTEVWNSKFGINFHSLTKEIEKLNEVNYYDINGSLIVCKVIINDYLLRIAEIYDYSKSGYKSNRDDEPDSDIIL